MFSYILLLVILSFKAADCSMNVTTSIQDDSAVIQVKMPDAVNMSKASLVLLFENGNVLFRMQDGEKKEASIAAGYKTRVQYIYSTTEGQVYLILLNFTKDDEGTYTCNFRCEGQYGSESFNLMVKPTEPSTTPTAGPVLTPTAGPGPTPTAGPGPTPTAGPGPTQGPTEPLSTEVPPEENLNGLWLLLLVPVAPVVLAPSVIWKVQRRRKQQVRDQVQNGDVVELQNLNGHDLARNNAEDTV